ncbi:MAG: biopolymer transporter ExbD [Planctomycetes bacterium]|nr:biopolymer transporter ExbD [Planctomycetota bacterium]
MIDVTFLLLIFFMVASTMQAQTELNVPAAKHGEGVPADACTEIIVLAPRSASETPRILLGDLKGPEGTVDDVRGFVEEGLREGKTEVVVKADRDVPSGFVQRVLKAISEVEGVQFSIGVQDEQSKR